MSSKKKSLGLSVDSGHFSKCCEVNAVPFVGTLSPNDSKQLPNNIANIRTNLYDTLDKMYEDANALAQSPTVKEKINQLSEGYNTFMNKPEVQQGINSINTGVSAYTKVAADSLKKFLSSQGVETSFAFEHLKGTNDSIDSVEVIQVEQISEDDTRREVLVCSNLEKRQDDNLIYSHQEIVCVSEGEYSEDNSPIMGHENISSVLTSIASLDGYDIDAIGSALSGVLCSTNSNDFIVETEKISDAATLEACGENITNNPILDKSLSVIEDQGSMAAMCNFSNGELYSNDSPTSVVAKINESSCKFDALTTNQNIDNEQEQNENSKHKLKMYNLAMQSEISFDEVSYCTPVPSDKEITDSTFAPHKEGCDDDTIH
uniref:Uncharacterized protein n=1 Tax=Corethron hystrix TaxID=216773 RepID=A0A7S1FY15_9STRA|mmetsp:Transcript_3949/g.7538  ORF Transcript_3949/g.7538 Transcript_3949/m.7538 type:complete len:374 (+) Transcript_3949:455-1576(+)